MASIVLGVKFSAASSGSGSFVYAVAVVGYLPPAAPYMIDGKTYRYRAENPLSPSEWEWGTAVYTLATGTFTRSVAFSSTGSVVAFTGIPQVGIIPFPADLLQFDDAMSLTVAQQTQGRQNLAIDKYGSAIVAAATLNLTTATGDTVPVTGTTTITAVTLAEGMTKRVRFASMLQLTYSASLVTPNLRDLVISPDDVVTFLGLSGGVAKVIGYASAKTPRLKVSRSAIQTLPHNSLTLIQFNSEQVDNCNCYDSTTNYRATPLVAGFYQFSLDLVVSGTSGRSYTAQAIIALNGVTESAAEYGGVLGSGATLSVTASSIIYMNGSTDYVDGRAYQYDYSALAAAGIGTLTHMIGNYLGPN